MAKVQWIPLIGTPPLQREKIGWQNYRTWLSKARDMYVPRLHIQPSIASAEKYMLVLHRAASARAVSVRRELVVSGDTKPALLRTKNDTKPLLRWIR